MTISDIQILLQAEVYCGCDFDREIHTACGSDMMSDVLAFVKDQSVLLTGLCNPQVIRTAEMMDILCIVFVRSKRPDDKMIALAQDGCICTMTTSLPMFTACGILYANGLRGGREYDG